LRYCALGHLVWRKRGVTRSVFYEHSAIKIQRGSQAEYSAPRPPR
jgi:hypothetical protein